MEQDNSCISWKSLPWSLFKRKIFHLQCKIYKAKKSGDSRLVRRMQKLLIHSKSSHFIATEFLVNSYTSSKYSLSNDEKYRLVSSIPNALRGNFHITLRLSESFKSLEFAKVLIIQYILRLALEPIYYDKSEWMVSKRDENLTKFVKKIRSHIKRLPNFGYNKVLKFDISFSLSSIKDTFIMKELSLPIKYKRFIYKSLLGNFSIGSILKNEFTDFLTNILISSKKTLDFFYKEGLRKQKNFSSGEVGFTYANTVICFLNSRDNFCNFVDILKGFFKNSGLNLRFSSISISSLDEGFSFLGLFFRRLRNKKVLISFTWENWVSYKKLFKSILIKNNNTLVKLRKIISLHSTWMMKYSIVSRSILKNKFFCIRKSIFKYSKSLKFLEKKILFHSIRLEIPS